MTELAQAVRQATQQDPGLGYADAGYTGERAQGIHLEGAKPPQVRKGFVWLPRRWVVEGSFGWVARFRRLAGGYEPGRACPSWLSPSRSCPNAPETL